VENQGFGHWQPLKIRDLESCENSQGREKDLGKKYCFWIIAYVRRQDAAKYVGKGITSCCGKCITDFLLL
jgi:hypothetical protein